MQYKFAVCCHCFSVNTIYCISSKCISAINCICNNFVFCECVVDSYCVVVVNKHLFFVFNLCSIDNNCNFAYINTSITSESQIIAFWTPYSVEVNVCNITIQCEVCFISISTLDSICLFFTISPTIEPVTFFCKCVCSKSYDCFINNIFARLCIGCFVVGCCSTVSVECDSKCLCLCFSMN